MGLPLVGTISGEVEMFLHILQMQEPMTQPVLHTKASKCLKEQCTQRLYTFFETQGKGTQKNRLPLEGFLRASPTRGKKERKGKN